MSGWLSVKNWNQFQHYKDRSPPWIKLYREMLSGEAWVMGNDQSRLVQVASTLLAARYSNKIPLNWNLIRKVCCLDMSEEQLAQAVEALIRLDFMEMHKDQEDTQHASTGSSLSLQTASTMLATCTSEKRREEERREEERQSTARQTAPEWFVEFKSVYPPRAGGQGWHKALKASNARIAEHYTPADMLAGARRYAAFIAATGKARTEFVQQAATFLGPDKHFLNPWNPPEATESPMEEIRRLNGLDKTRGEHERTLEPEDTRSVGRFIGAFRS